MTGAELALTLCGRVYLPRPQRAVNRFLLLADGTLEKLGRPAL